MRINHAPLWMGLIWIIVGATCFGIGILTGAHVLTALGMVGLPSGILYGLLAGHPSGEAPPS
jgi:hypothetical protein